MIIHNKFIFAHLTKTGGTFIRQYLRENIQGSIIEMYGKKIEKHAALVTISPFVLESRIKFGFIRNPYDFYISLWSANTTKRAINNRPRRKIWFKDNEIKENSNRFIHFLINEETINVNFFDFPLMHKMDIGVLTYRYLYLYYDHEIFKDQNWIRNHKKYKLVDKVLLFENGLVKELDEIFRQNIFPLDKKQRKVLYNYPQKNKSQHGYFMDYYDDETIDLIRHKDRFILKLHYPELLCK